MAGAEHPPYKTLYATLFHGYRHPHTMNQKDQKCIVESGERTACSGNPIRRETNCQKGDITQNNLATKIVGIKQ